MSKGDAAEKAWQARGYCTLASDEIGPHEQMAFFDGRASLEPLVEELVAALAEAIKLARSLDTTLQEGGFAFRSEYLDDAILAAAREQGFGA